MFCDLNVGNSAEKLTCTCKYNMQIDWMIWNFADFELQIFCPLKRKVCFLLNFRPLFRFLVQFFARKSLWRIDFSSKGQWFCKIEEIRNILTYIFRLTINSTKEVNFKNSDYKISLDRYFVDEKFQLKVVFTETNIFYKHFIHRTPVQIVALTK